VEFPDDVRDTSRQVSFALTTLKEEGGQLLTEAGFGAAAQILDAGLVRTAAEKVRRHIRSQGDLKAEAVQRKLVPA
jgi:hypothetical protein